MSSKFKLKPGDLCAEKRVQVIEITLLIHIFLSLRSMLFALCVLCNALSIAEIV